MHEMHRDTWMRMHMTTLDPYAMRPSGTGWRTMWSWSSLVQAVFCFRSFANEAWYSPQLLSQSSACQKHSWTPILCICSVHSQQYAGPHQMQAVGVPLAERCSPVVGVWTARHNLRHADAEDIQRDKEAGDPTQHRSTEIMDNFMVLQIIRNTFILMVTLGKVHRDGVWCRGSASNGTVALAMMSNLYPQWQQTWTQHNVLLLDVVRYNLWCLGKCNIGQDANALTKLSPLFLNQQTGICCRSATVSSVSCNTALLKRSNAELCGKWAVAQQYFSSQNAAQIFRCIQQYLCDSLAGALFSVPPVSQYLQQTLTWCSNTHSP